MTFGGNLPSGLKRGVLIGAVARKEFGWKAPALAVAATAGVLFGWSGLASAHGPGAQGLTPVVEANVAVNGPIRINAKENARVITTHITVAPGGHTGWHSHPGPHFVSVRTGTVVVYETDCSIRGTFPAGTGFFDPGSTSPSHVQASRDIHTLRNPSPTEAAEVIITDIREGGQPPTVNVAPQPPSCFP